MKKTILIESLIFMSILVINCKSKNVIQNQGIITHDNLLLRTKPNIINGKIISKLKKNEKVTLLGKSNKKVKIGKYISYWYKIKTQNNKIGWSYGAFIRTKNEKNLIIKNIKIYRNNQKLTFKLKGTYKSPHTKIIFKNDEDLIFYVNYCEGYSPVNAKYKIKGIKLYVNFIRPITVAKKVKQSIFYILNSDLIFNPGPTNLSCGPIYNAFFKSKRFKPITKKNNFPFILGLYKYKDMNSSKNYFYFHPNKKLISFHYSSDQMTVDIFYYTIKNKKIICQKNNNKGALINLLKFRIVNNVPIPDNFTCRDFKKYILK